MYTTAYVQSLVTLHSTDMIRCNKLLLSLPLLFVLSGCNTVYYKANIQQGNLIVQEQIDQLKLGMTKASVIELLGDSLTFQESTESLEYIYANYPAYGKAKKKRMVLNFQDDKLKDFYVTN